MELIRQQLFWLLLLCSSSAVALSWHDLWFTPDQQGAKALQQGQAQQAAKLFTAPKWQGVAHYRSGQYQQALEDFSKADDATAWYNKGNALAQLHQYQAAIDAYNQALKQQADFSDAKYNKALIEKLLKQQHQNAANNKQSKNGQPNQQKQESSNNDHSQRQQSQQPNFADNKANQNKQPNQSPSQVGDKQTQNQPPQPKQVQQTPKSIQGQQLLQPQQSKTNPQTAKNEQELNQWLSQIPDDSGGLLKQKFLRDHLRMQKESNSW